MTWAAFKRKIGEGNNNAVTNQQQKGKNGSHRPKEVASSMWDREIFAHARTARSFLSVKRRANRLLKNSFIYDPLNKAAHNGEKVL